MKATYSKLIFILAVVAVFFWSATATAGAWAQDDRGIYAKLAGSFEFANEQYKESGETFQLLSEDDPGSFRTYNSNLYVEFGLLPKLTAIASGSFKSLTVDSEAVRATTTGLSDLQFGLKLQFLDKPLVLSAMLTGGFPMGYTVTHPDPRTPALGNGVPTGEASLLIGKSLYPIPIYVSGSAGFRIRGDRSDGPNYPPEVPLFFEVGYGPTDWLWARGVVSANWGLGNPEAIDTVSFSPATQRYVKVGPSVIFNIAGTYQVNVDYLYAPWGVNTLRSHQVSVGFAIDTVLASHE